MRMISIYQLFVYIARRSKAMSRRTVGVSLIAIAAVLYATRYIAAAIFGSGVSSWSSNIFRAMQADIGNDLVWLSIIALIGGILYLMWAEIDVVKKSQHYDQFQKSFD